MCTQEDCVVIWEKERVLGEVAYGLGIVCKFSSCTWLKLLSQFTNNLQNAKHQKKPKMFARQSQMLGILGKVICG